VVSVSALACAGTTHKWFGQLQTRLAVVLLFVLILPGWVDTSWSASMALVSQVALEATWEVQHYSHKELHARSVQATLGLVPPTFAHDSYTSLPECWLGRAAHVVAATAFSSRADRSVAFHSISSSSKAVWSKLVKLLQLLSSYAHVACHLSDARFVLLRCMFLAI